MQPAAPSLGAQPTAAIALGPFVLQRTIGAGGMGEVWQAVHAEEHVPVAIKVISAHWARHDGLRRAFQREVRAVAGLSHPAIVAVFDDGVVGANAAARSGGRLAEGSPYLAMEYLPRGNLEALLPVLDWPLVQVVAEGTLAALAHAHARGVIHCDLKPGNVLLSGWSEVAIKLTDFGVAHALGPGDEEEGEGGASSAGTPAYMAPEQLLGRLRDYGPWTDLYALGCTIWEMCCGHPPFLALDLPRLAGMHLYESPGAFQPVFSVPSGVEAWLRRLLAKRALDRFTRAADALAGLRAFSPSGGPVPWSAVALRGEAIARRAPTRPSRPGATSPDPTRRFVVLPPSTRAMEGAGPEAASRGGEAEATLPAGAVNAVATTQMAPGTGESGATGPSAPPADETDSSQRAGEATRTDGAGSTIRLAPRAGEVDRTLLPGEALAPGRGAEMAWRTGAGERGEMSVRTDEAARELSPETDISAETPARAGETERTVLGVGPPGGSPGDGAEVSARAGETERTVLGVGPLGGSPGGGAEVSARTGETERTVLGVGPLGGSPGGGAEVFAGTGETERTVLGVGPLGGSPGGQAEVSARTGETERTVLAAGPLAPATESSSSAGAGDPRPAEALGGADTLLAARGGCLAGERGSAADRPWASGQGPGDIPGESGGSGATSGALENLSPGPGLEAPAASAGGPGGAASAAPFPETWRLPHDAAASRPLHGVGLGLVRVRELPLVGRDAERDRLWAALARVRAEGRPRLVLVRGASGVGKSRLVEWTAARAHELGAAEVLRAAHGPFGGTAEGLPRMLALHLRCVGLRGDETYARCLAALSGGDPSGGDEVRLEAAALTELLCPGQDGAGRPRVRLHDARERHHVIAGYLARVGAGRPAVVWIDDAQWASGALELVRHCLRRGEPGPRALFIATVRDDLLGERAAEAGLLAELAGLPGVETLSLMPLPEDQHHALIEELLGLERGLVDAIVARTGGNPLFSVQLVGDWIARGLLRAGPGGFSLREGAEVDLPDDLHALWRRRVEDLLARHFSGAAGEAARAALELAAAIGQEIDAAAWALACRLAGIEAPPELALVLVRERLAAATPAGIAFAHGMLRESLERLAEDAGRSAMHHRTCAKMLRHLGVERVPGHVEQVARHLIAAGDLREALAPLLESSYQMQLAGQYGRAEAALREHAALADRLELPPHALDRLRGRMQAAWLAWMRGGEGGGSRGAAEVEAIIALARAHGYDEIVGEAMRWRGLVARFERRADDSLAALAEAVAAFERTGDAEGLARTALAQAVTLRLLGQIAEAEDRLAEAERLARARGLAVLLPRILGNLAESALQRGDWPEAQVRFARALAAAEQIGDRKALALTSGGAGDLAFVVGDLEAAESHYRRAEALFASLGSRYLGGIRLHLAALDLVRGRTGAADALRAVIGEPGREGARDPLQAGLAHLALAVAAEEPGAQERHLAAAEDRLARAGEARRVLVCLAERAADAAERRGWSGPAVRARGLARAQEARLDAGEGA